MTSLHIPIGSTLCALTLQAVTVAEPASAMGVTNCSRVEIRISVHDRLAGKPVVDINRPAKLAPGKSLSFELSDGRYLVKIFRHHGDQRRLIYLKPDLDGSKDDYTVHLSGLYTSIRAGSDCTNAKPIDNQTVALTDDGADPAMMLATHMVHPGIWVSGSTTWFRITGFDGNSFRLRLSDATQKATGTASKTGPDRWSTYRLTGRNRYRDADGNVFRVLQEFKAEWNGTPHRYSWLE